MSLPRFLAPTLEFVIPGRPLCGGNGRTVKGMGDVGNSFIGGAAAYSSLIRLCAKSAMYEQGWKIKEDALYISIVIYLGVGNEKHPAIIKKMYKGEIIPLRDPHIVRLVNVICKTLKGIVYKKEWQIAGLFVAKRYSKEQRVEVLIGNPKTQKELEHDIRNS